MLNKIMLLSFLLSLLASPALAANCPQTVQWGFPSHKIARATAVSGNCQTETSDAPFYQKEETPILSMQVPRQDSGLFIDTTRIDKIARLNFAVSLLRPLASGQAYSSVPAHKQAR